MHVTKVGSALGASLLLVLAACGAPAVHGGSPAHGGAISGAAATATTPKPAAGPRALVAGSVSPTCSAGAAVSGGGAPTTGTAYYDMNQNGQQDPGEPGLAGIPLFLSRGPDSETPGVEKTPSTCTDSAGHFSITSPDKVQGYRIEFRTGWYRSQCSGLTCVAGAAGNNMAAGPEWIYTDAFTGAAAHEFNVGLIPDAGQYVVGIHAKAYTNYPPDLSQAHAVDLAARFTDDETVGCRTTTNGVSCHIGQTMAQTLYIANAGLSPVSGIHAVMELPYGEVHQTLQLLRSGTSPGITTLSDVTVVPASGPRAKGQAASTDNYTTITFTIGGTLPPSGLIAVMSQDILRDATPGTQIIGRAGITAEDDSAADTDSAFCRTPVIPASCGAVSDTHSFLDLRGDDNDSDRFNVLA